MAINAQDDGAPHRWGWRLTGLAVVAIGLGAATAGVAASWLLGPLPAEFADGLAVASDGLAAADDVVQLRASNADDFDTEQLQVAADEALVIEFFNDDTSPHDVAIETSAGKLTGGPLANPGTSMRYEFPAGSIPVGQHQFFCTLHPWMRGILVAERAAQGSSSVTVP